MLHTTLEIHSHHQVDQSEVGAETRGRVESLSDVSDSESVSAAGHTDSV